MTKHHSIKLNAQGEDIFKLLDQALQLCSCSVQVELAVQDTSNTDLDTRNTDIDINCDVILLLCRSGYELESHVVSMVSRRTEIPVMLYLSDYNEVAELVGLRTGACDVLNGEMTANVIAERIMAVHRRSSVNSTKWIGVNKGNPNFETKGWGVDLENNILWIENASVELTSTEIKLIEVLMANRGAVVTRNELAAATNKGAGSNVKARTVDSHIKRIRQKINETGKKIGVIKSVYGAGYRFVLPDLPLKS